MVVENNTTIEYAMKRKQLLPTFGLAMALILSLPAPRALAVVGYVVLTLGGNRYHLIENPLSNPPDTLNAGFGEASIGSRVWIWDVTNQVFVGPSTYLGAAGWSVNYSIPVGKGFMFHSPAETEIAFVGEVLPGWQTNFVAGTNRLSLLGAMIPQAGGLSSVLEFQPRDGGVVYQFSSGAQRYLDARTYFSGFGWFTNEPNLVVAEAFFVQHPGPDTNWVRNIIIRRPAGRASPTATKSLPEIENCSIRGGKVTLKVNRAIQYYDVQFSPDGQTWTNLAVNQKARIWSGPLPKSPTGYFQVLPP